MPEIRYRDSFSLSNMNVRDVNAGSNHGENQPSAVSKTQEKEKKSETHRAGQTPLGLAVPGTKQPTLLLHACCAPCATHVLELLSRSFSVTAFFYNPNIHPDEEYDRRLEAMRRLCRLTDTPLLVESSAPAVWEGWVRGHEHEPEQGRRCLLCFKGRLAASLHIAEQHAFAFMATTLTVSPRKNSADINEIGLLVAAGSKVRYLESDFKKQDGFRRSCELSRRYSLYRQHYCGCRYSRGDRDTL